MARISGRIAATASKLASSQDRRGETSGCPMPSARRSSRRCRRSGATSPGR